MKGHRKRLYSFACLLFILLIAGCRNNGTPIPPPADPAGTSPQSRTAPAGRVTALGTILPARQLKLSFATSGPLLSVDVQVGAEVQAGDRIAALDTTDLKMSVREAQEELALAQAMLVQAQVGPQAQQIAVAEAEYQQALALYEQAQATHKRALTRTHPQEVAIAQAQYDAALARYEQVKAGASPEELAVAQAQLQKAEIALQQAQAAYDRVATQPDLGARPEAAALHSATINYQMVKAEYEHLKNLPSRAALQEAKAQVDEARAQLRLAQTQPDGADVAASAGSVAVAQAQLDMAETGPRPEDVTVVEAQVQQARTALEYAQLALSRAQLLTPFAGTISAVYLQPGEWAESGAPVVELLDTSRWRVETRNIGELNIGRVKVGQEAIVRVIAFRTMELRGRVVAVSPVAVVQQGDTTYTAYIELEPMDLNLRPGMNAEVEIGTE